GDKYKVAPLPPASGGRVPQPHPSRSVSCQKEIEKVMLAPSHYLALVLTLLTGAWLARTTLAQVSCDPNELLDRNQCAEAISQILYDQPENTLDRLSTIFAKLAGNCTVCLNRYRSSGIMLRLSWTDTKIFDPNYSDYRLESKQSRSVSQIMFSLRTLSSHFFFLFLLCKSDQIEASNRDGYASIFNQCQPNSGQTPLFDGVYLQSQNHSSGHDTDYFPPQTLTCGLNNAPLTVGEDCQDAFESIFVDNKDRMVDDNFQPTSSITKTRQTCTSSGFETIEDCEGKSGVVSSTEGGSGYNGFTVVKVRSSKRCGSRSDSEGQNLTKLSFEAHRHAGFFSSPSSVTLLTGTWLAHDSLAQVSCDPGELFDTKQCAQAIAQIVYDKPQNTLDRFSTIFAKLAGNCTIIVQNPQKRAITKQQIEAGYAKIFDQCQPNAGQAPVGDAYLLSQNHSSEHDTDFFPPRTLTCGLNLNAPLTAEKDCEDAFKSILVDRQGRLLGDKNKPAPTILKTLQTCTKSEIGSVVSKTIKQCKGKSGVVSMTKGGSGNNGLTVVKVRSSKRCGSRVDSEGQVCY
ncbi:hypothetical protein PSTT_12568, partial [Puccinia striiformis]